MIFINEIHITYIYYIIIKKSSLEYLTVFWLFGTLWKCRAFPKIIHAEFLTANHQWSNLEEFFYKLFPCLAKKIDRNPIDRIGYRSTSLLRPHPTILVYLNHTNKSATNYFPQIDFRLLTVLQNLMLCSKKSRKRKLLVDFSSSDSLRLYQTVGIIWNIPDLFFFAW